MLKIFTGCGAFSFMMMILFLTVPIGAGESETREAVFPQSILVTTDKVSYKPGEDVTITIRNLSRDIIYAHVGVEGIKDVEKKDLQGGWEKLPPRCQPPHCFYDIGPPEEIGPGVAKTFVWKPLIYVSGTTKVLSASPGTYRLSFLWQDRERKGWKVAHSNNFDIERP
jgi:hypothetical protein